jgi:hypothetical protein
LNQKILDLIESNQLGPFDSLELDLQIFENIKKNSSTGEKEAKDRIVKNLCDIFRSYEQILIDPILNQLDYFNIGNLEESIEKFLNNNSKSSIENLDVRFDVLKVEFKLNTLALNAKVLLKNDLINVTDCVVQTKLFKLNLRQ